MLAAARAELASGQSDAAKGASTKPPHKKRIRNFTADDRAAHRIFEKKRRELFRERLNDLARELPALAGKNPSRLSKHDVLDESISRHKLEHATCLDLIDSFRDIIQERDELLAEVNTWRATSGIAERQPTATQLDLEELDRLESKIRGDQSETFSGDTSCSPDLGLATMNQDLTVGQQQDLPSYSPPIDSSVAVQVAAWDAPDRNEHPKPPQPLVTTIAPTDQLPHSSVLHDPQMEAVEFMQTTQDDQTTIIPPQNPLNEVDGSQITGFQLGNQITDSALDEIIPYNSMPDTGSFISLPAWPDGTDFTIPMTSTIDFGANPLLQEYSF
ncbi:hypothetical protein NW762_008917 [Fusarium torreyae]|uniref:BHLH domain-containing protein n=1 Tax=Fusarium torreyae TaxID=1237075 RepID=A0A9W8RW84_9HYPO|nr:hypothetical protein NW762_008917 [Fusarium torreyae]